MEKRANVAIIRKQLEKRRDDLLARTDALKGALSGVASFGHPGDAVLRLLTREDRIEAEAISGALARIAAGTYGTCTTCGHPIGDARLLALPETPQCRACAMAEDDMFDNVPV